MDICHQRKNSNLPDKCARKFSCSLPLGETREAYLHLAIYLRSKDNFILTLITRHKKDVFLACFSASGCFLFLQKFSPQPSENISADMK